MENQIKEDDSPLGIAEKGVRLGREWFENNLKRDRLLSKEEGK